MEKLTTLKPFLFQAYYNWILENKITPHLLVDCNFPGVKVPKAYVKEIHQGPCTLELLINQHNPGMNFYIHKGMVKVRDTGFDMGDFFINEEVLSLEIK